MAKKILIVDDNSALCESVKTYLEKQGFDVVCVSDGWACITSINQHHPDLILLDIEMPKMSGIETLQMMINYNLMQDTRVLMLTGLCEKKIVLQAIKLGAKDYIAKPFELATLMDRITKQFSSVTPPAGRHGGFAK